MDILAARKKAAERAKREKAPEPPSVAEAPGREEPPAAGTGADRTAVDREAVVTQQERAPELGAAAPPAEAEPVAALETDSVSPQPDVAVEAPPVEEQDREMLSVLLGSEEYAVPVDCVREVLSPREITPVPHTSAYILGVSSLRGTVLPIIDLKQRLGLAGTGADEKTRIVVVGLNDDDRVGLLVDRVRGVFRFPAAAIRPVPETVEQGEEFLAGIVRRDDRLIILLDVQKTTAA